MFAAGSNSFELILSNVADGQTADNTIGTNFTCALSNAYGSWTQLLSSGNNTDDSYWVSVWFHRIGVASVASDALAEIGIDPAGGTSYTTVIPSLLVSCATPVAGGGVIYEFPLFIPAGASIAVRGQVNAGASVTIARCVMHLGCRPTNPEELRVGTFVRAFGATVASSSGTTVTPGTAANGSWVDLGTAAEDLFYVEVGLGINDATMTGGVVLCDISGGQTGGDSFLLRRVQFITTASESIAKSASGKLCKIANGDHIFGRAQFSSTLDSNYSMIAYAVGG